jgi:lipoprotein signal peptidase
VIRALVVLLGAAAVVATLDLTHKALSVSEQGGAVLAHDRPGSYVAGLAAVSIAWTGAIALVRSASIALVGGLVLGGAVGNLVSFALWPSLPGVPDPLIAGGFAFNLADVSAVLGLALLAPTILVFALHNRERLFDPI